jgi:hypothetical protein
MPLRPATKDIYLLINSEFDVSNTSLTGGVQIHTGKWGQDRTDPTIACYNKDEGVIDGGETNQTAFSGQATGGTMQRRGGSVTIDCVAGTRDELRGAGAGGADLNPKQVRFELAKEVVRITQSFGLTGYDSLAPGSTTDLVATSDEEDVKPTFLTQVPVRYTYQNRP